jgi:virginiamycin B lyase
MVSAAQFAPILEWVRALLVLAGALLLALVAVPSAGAHIYWANKYDDAIGRSDLDGTGVNQRLITVRPNSHPVGLAVDASHVYWTNFEAADSVGRANLDGSGANQDFIRGASDPVGIAVDGAHIYWTNAAANTIGRADLDGTHVNQSFITGAKHPYGLAVDGSHVYWANVDTKTFGRANLDGTHLNQSFMPGPADPRSIAVDGSYLYWVDSANNEISRANLDGTESTFGFIHALDPWGLAVQGTRIYWTNQGPPKTVGRANIDGSNAEESFLPASAYGVYGVAVSPLHTALRGGPTGFVASRAASFSFSSSEPAGFECRLDARPFLPCASPSSSSGLSNGRHTFAVRAAGAGNVDPTPPTRTWTVDTRAPRLRRLRLRRTLVRFSLSEAARVRFRVQRRKGRRTRILRGSFTRLGKRGADRARFHRRLRRHRLKPGRYFLVATATDFAGNRSRSVRVRFTVRR